MARRKNDAGLSNLIKEAAGVTGGSQTTQGADDVLKHDRAHATKQIQVPRPAASATRRRRDREDTTTLTIHVDRELHTDIKKLALKIERPAEVMLRRALRRLVTDAMKGRGNKYID